MARVSLNRGNGRAFGHTRSFSEQMAIRLAPLLALRVYEMPVELAPIPLALI